MDELGPVPTGLTEDRYIKAVEVKEVRLLSAAEKAAARKDSRRGFGNFTIHHIGVHSSDEVFQPQTDLDREDRSRFRMVYSLGQNATIYPDDTGVLLKAGADLRFTGSYVCDGRGDPGAGGRWVCVPPQGLSAEVQAVRLGRRWAALKTVLTFQRARNARWTATTRCRSMA